MSEYKYKYEETESRRRKKVKENSPAQRRMTMFQSRLSIVFICVLIFTAILIGYLFLIQVMDVRHYRAKASIQRAGKLFTMRGDIFDRNGIKLATDKIYSDVYAHRKDFVHEPEELAKILSPILKIPKDKLYKKLTLEIPVITLAKDVDRNTAKEISKLQLREISLGKKNIRVYPQGTLAAHVLGYYNADADMANGVEYTAKDKLEHVENPFSFKRTPDGNIIYDFSTDAVAAASKQKGENVTLTINAAIQHVCEKELEKMVVEKDALRGTVIVMNPKNGEILALAAYPTFDPNHYKTYKQNQLRNWMLTDVFPPGSTFKIITVASAMELGKINRYTKINDTGKMMVGRKEVKNYDYRTHPNPGMISLVYLFEHSSNIASAKIALMMSRDEFHDMLTKFGYGSRTGIDLPGESVGILAPAKRWDESRRVTMGYGYGTSVTAIQMVSAVSALANKGVKVTPHVIKYNDEEKAARIFETPVVSPETAKTVTDLLVESVNNGKSNIKLEKYNVAAKTGTSSKSVENGVGYTNFSYTSTIGYFPAADPQVLIYVMVDSPRGGAIWGNTVAAPVWREVALQTARILNLKPDKVPVAKKE
ncbi:penicillin-binding protein 2 [bacterium]|nr:penicillin-binding protein 2 [bacterium]